MTEVYKVVSVTLCGKLRSGYIPWVVINSRLIRRYSPGETVSAQNGMKLFAFGNRSQAVKWASRLNLLSLGQGEVWRAEATGVEALGEILPMNLLNFKTARTFWHGGDDSKRDVERAPKGTVGCETIKLIEKVA